MASEFGISFDISKARTGIATWRDGVPTGVESVSFSKTAGVEELLWAWAEFLYDWMPYPAPEGKSISWVAFEQAVPRGMAHREQFYGMTGMLRVRTRYFAEADIYPVNLATAKKALAGIGNADKASMVVAARKRWPHLPEMNHDEADALGIGLVALVKRGKMGPLDVPGAS